MQKKLLVEVSLTFSRAVEIAQSMESAAVRTKQLQSHMNTGGQHQRDVNHLASTSNTSYRCGRVDHQSAHCPIQDCHNCGKQGHIQAARRQPKKQTFPTNKRGRGRGNYCQTRGRGRSIRTVQEEPDNLEFDLNNIRRLNQVNTNHTWWISETQWKSTDNGNRHWSLRVTYIGTDIQTVISEEKFETIESSFIDLFWTSNHNKR